MNTLSTSTLLIAMTSVLLLTACSTASKHEPAPYVAAPQAPMTPMYEPKPDRN